MKITDVDIIQRLGRSTLFIEFKNAFETSMGLPLALRPFEFWQLAHRSQPYENPFCAMVTETNRGRSACLEAEQHAVSAAQDRSATIRCFADLCHTAVPIKLGERAIGFLLTGQIALDSPSPDRFEAIFRQLADPGVKIDRKRLEDVYYQSRVFSPQQYAGLTRLLEIFGQQLSAFANRLMLQNAQNEDPMVRRARAYIDCHHADRISLDDIARSTHVSTFHFCKIFKKATGLTFTQYLGRIRVEKAKQLLLNPHLRVGEIAYAVGFQSLTAFNRIFREITGQAPSRFRGGAKHLAKSATKNCGPSRSAPKHLSERAIRLAA
jgi:AraC-like DNA-binding protein/ligand-binding sensor protein